ncbi:MAG: transglycosylase SLT domain-containing protein [Candidatus Eisenbacteria bacterium]
MGKSGRSTALPRGVRGYAALVLLRVFTALPSAAHAGARAHAAGRKGAEARSDRFDESFRKYSKRYFGPDYDWRDFKAQGLTESNLDTTARSQVGARGVMQLMPSTFREVASKNPDIQRRIDDPEWNIAAGISYDRRLWRQWEQDSVAAHRREFMFASYNAGRGTLLQAQEAARARQLDCRSWPDIEQVAPDIRRWRYRETLDYLRRIDGHLLRLDGHGRLSNGPTASWSVVALPSGPAPTTVQRLAVPAGPAAPPIDRRLRLRGAMAKGATRDSTTRLRVVPRDPARGGSRRVR